jgi:hypothetical protein
MTSGSKRSVRGMEAPGLRREEVESRSLIRKNRLFRS